ncbi:CCA tRNA nucleotidyltransferase [Patescibacteria group bacterium]|nr:CCA tRNA nucleotidyltransferase [Patescibacteria group bacterium]MBU1500447.1 CCA tRNA nucleotidyltransferase [Patescibacteria group bacterium]MBU2080515.1 CCA tRNA nucleotidyltransferase [Patescibacteria group bacterium]MBU2123680.1 CCA tRNA nucleotidyltransferase [Patescibacteria group bacterium]MBU2194536.1 CCA tRNA nucleotidyltransferase [Patescibacteria group bacterium]
MQFRIPEEVTAVTDILRTAGHEAYLVGGCVRDLLIGRTPKDWDVTTNAKPEDIQGLFPDSFYENDFGTVGIKTGSENPLLAVIEVTPYRTESGYSDKRRPDAVSFGDNLEEDLARRDFTINAIALDDSKGQIVDPYKGQKDIESRVLRTVGTASERFEEDALRLMRAVRLVAELEFALDTDTAAAIKEKGPNLEHISRERIRDEFVKIILSPQPMMALVLCQQLGLLQYIAPELTKGIGIDQNQAHSYDVFGHLMRALQHAADKEWDLDLRLAALYHDVSKPETRRWSDEKKDWTFHGHEVVGARVTKKALEELRFSRETIEKVTKLVRWHMFFSDPDQITLSAVRRMIRNVGQENIWELLNLRICDRIGTGRPKEQPFRFRRYKAMVEEALRDPISVGMLKTDGEHIMDVFHVKPGRQIGYVLHALLEEVLEDPKRNTVEYLDSRTKELLQLPEEDLKKLGESGKKSREVAEEQEIRDILSKHHVG